jgi:hypothetical protein
MLSQAQDATLVRLHQLDKGAGVCNYTLGTYRDYDPHNMCDNSRGHWNAYVVLQRRSSTAALLGLLRKAGMVERIAPVCTDGPCWQLTAAGRQYLGLDLEA